MSKHNHFQSKQNHTYHKLNDENDDDSTYFPCFQRATNQESTPPPANALNEFRERWQQELISADDGENSSSSVTSEQIPQHRRESNLLLMEDAGNEILDEIVDNSPPSQEQQHDEEKVRPKKFGIANRSKYINHYLPSY